MFERSFTGNQALILAAQMKFEVLKHHFWGKFAKFNTPGNKVIAKKANMPKPIRSPIVMQHELERNMGDVIKIPLLRNLVELPTIGLDQLKGHEERQKINHAQVPIDILRHAVMPQEGLMSTQTTKDYQLIKNAKPQLLRAYAEYEEYLGCSYAFYYGYSWNILQSARYTGNSENITSNSHPHIFVAGQGKVSYGTTDYPGTAGYETNVATAIDAMTDTNVFDTNFLSGLKAHDQIKRINPIIMHDGNEMLMIVAHPYQIHQLEQDVKFREVTALANAQAYAKHNPMLVGCKYVWAGFVIFESETAIWQVSTSSGSPVYGPSTISDLSSFKDYSSATKFAAIILGDNALFKGTGHPLEFKKRVDDYDEIIGIAFRVLEGYSRADYWNDDDGTRGASMKNDGSAVAITYSEAPSM